MMTEAALAIEVHDLGTDGAARDLLVLTDAERCGRNGLALPFHNATVMEIGDTEEIDIEGSYDFIVIDRNSSDPRWLDAVSARLLAALHPEGRLVVTLDPGRSAPCATDHAADHAALAGLAWQGLGILRGRPCAVLRVEGPTDASPVASGVLLATAETAVRLAAAGMADSMFAADRAQTARVAQFDDRRQSEKALLRHLDALARELDEERRQHQGIELVRTILRRSKLAGPVRRILRPLLRVVRKPRSVVGRLKRVLAGKLRS